MVRAPLKLRTSKYRHIYGAPTRKENCYENVRITKSAHDSNFCCVNPKFIAVVVEGVGGGSFLVLHLKRIGRIDPALPKICGHSGPVTDIKWNPFDDHVIASGSEDTTVKVWEVPEVGLVTNLTRWMVELKGHGRRVDYIEWHPTAENILASTGYDFKCIIWNVGTGDAVRVIECHPSTIFSLSWNRDGSLLGTTCKDKKLRVIDPRTGVVQQDAECHTSLKASKMSFCGDKQRIVTAGSSKGGARQIAVWDSTNLADGPLTKVDIDYSSGILLMYYDLDTHVVYLAGKGDGNIRYFEVVDADPHICFLNQYGSSDPQRSMGVMPKRGMDIRRCEIARFYKLHSTKSTIEPLPMIVPRRSADFQEDIYPPTASCSPALTAAEWIAGVNRDPVLVSMKNLQKDSSGSKNGSGGSSRRGSLREIAEQRKQEARTPPVSRTATPPIVIDDRLPASLKNIHKLSSRPAMEPSSLTATVVTGQPFASSQPSETAATTNNGTAVTANPSAQSAAMSGMEGGWHGSGPSGDSSSGNGPSYAQVLLSAGTAHPTTGVNQAAESPVSTSHQPLGSSVSTPVHQGARSATVTGPTSPSLKAGSSYDEQIRTSPSPPPRSSSQRNYSVTLGDTDLSPVTRGGQGSQAPRASPIRWRDNRIWQQHAGAINPAVNGDGPGFNRGTPRQRSFRSTLSTAPSNRSKVAPTMAGTSETSSISRPLEPSSVATTSSTVTTTATNGSFSMPITNEELHLAYFRQVEEMKSLRQQVGMKDHRIQQLEEEVANLQVQLRKSHITPTSPVTSS